MKCNFTKKPSLHSYRAHDKMFLEQTLFNVYRFYFTNVLLVGTTLGKVNSCIDKKSSCRFHNFSSTWFIKNPTAFLTNSFDQKNAAFCKHFPQR